MPKRSFWSVTIVPLIKPVLFLRLSARAVPKSGTAAGNSLHPQTWKPVKYCETELSVLIRQCPDRRIPDIETLRSETKAWELRRNTDCKTADWQFTAEDARIKLKRFYPQF